MNTDFVLTNEKFHKETNYWRSVYADDFTKYGWNFNEKLESYGHYTVLYFVGGAVARIITYNHNDDSVETKSITRSEIGILADMMNMI